MRNSITEPSSVTRAGPDLAKTASQIHAVGAKGETTITLALKRGAAPKVFGSPPGRLVAMEAFSSTHRWARPLFSRSGEESGMRAKSGDIGPRPFEPAVLRSATPYEANRFGSGPSSGASRHLLPNGRRGHAASAWPQEFRSPALTFNLERRRLTIARAAPVRYTTTVVKNVALLPQRL